MFDEEQKEINIMRDSNNYSTEATYDFGICDFQEEEDNVRQETASISCVNHLPQDSDNENPQNLIYHDKKIKRKLLVEVVSVPIGVISTLRMELRKMFKSGLFEFIIMLLIFINATLLGISTFEFASENQVVQSSSNFFLILFTVELCLNVFSFGLESYKHPWVILDACIVLPSWFARDIVPLRALRILRLFRVFKYSPSLKRLTTALLSTGPEMTSVMVFLILIFYIFAVLFTQLFGDCYEDGCYCEVYPSCETGQGINYFGRLDFTFFTLAMLMTLDSWSDIIRMTQRKYPWSYFPLMVFMMLSAFVVLNLVIAVLCEALNKIREAEIMETEVKKKKLISRLTQSITGTFSNFSKHPRHNDDGINQSTPKVRSSILKQARRVKSCVDFGDNDGSIGNTPKKTPHEPKFAPDCVSKTHSMIEISDGALNRVLEAFEAERKYRDEQYSKERERQEMESKRKDEQINELKIEIEQLKELIILTTRNEKYT